MKVSLPLKFGSVEHGTGQGFIFPDHACWFLANQQELISNVSRANDKESGTDAFNQIASFE